MPGDLLQTQGAAGSLHAHQFLRGEQDAGAYTTLYDATIASGQPTTLPSSFRVDAESGDEALLVVLGPESISPGEVATVWPVTRVDTGRTASFCRRPVDLCDEAWFDAALLTLLVGLVVVSAPARAQATAPHRYAVVVGANKASPGRRDLPLRPQRRSRDCQHVDPRGGLRIRQRHGPVGSRSESGPRRAGHLLARENPGPKHCCFFTTPVTPTPRRCTRTDALCFCARCASGSMTGGSASASVSSMRAAAAAGLARRASRPRRHFPSSGPRCFPTRVRV